MLFILLVLAFAIVAAAVVSMGIALILMFYDIFTNRQE